MYFYSKIHTKLSPNKLWIIAKENPSKRLFINYLVQVSCMKIVQKTCPFHTKSVKHYNMHILLSCSTFVEDRENMLENILEILDVYEYVLFDNQDPELQFLSLMGCINGTSFEKNIVYKMEKCHVTCCIYTLYKQRVFCC